MNCRITAESGSSILGKCSDFTSPLLPVIEPAPINSEFEKNENKKTPVNRKGTKLSGLESPRMNPKIRPYMTA
jgi:hypothetical protein